MASAAATRLESRRLGESVSVAHLPQGLTVYVLPRPGYAKRYACFATRYGSVDNRFALAGGETHAVPDGIAHFLEHQMFAQEYGDAFERFSELGASANAFTTYTSTTYLFSCTDNFAPALRLLLDFVQQPHFTDAGTAKERGIIQQEIRMYQDNPAWRLRQGLHGCLYSAHPFRIDIAGTVETVERITTDLLQLCYRTFYHPANMVLAVVGDVDADEVLQVAQESLTAHEHGPARAITRMLPQEPAVVASPRAEYGMAVARPMVAVGFKEREVGVRGLDLLRRDVATEFLLEVLFGRASDFYNRLYESGLIDRSFGAGYYGEETFGLSRLGGETDRPAELEAAILEAVEAARRSGVDRAGFEAARRSAIGEFVAEFNAPEALGYLLNASHFAGVSLFDHLEAVESVTLEQVEQRLREHLDPAAAAVAVVLPDGAGTGTAEV